MTTVTACHSLMLSFHDLRGLLLQWLHSTVPCSLAFCCICYRQIWPNHDNLRRFTVDNKIFKHPTRTSIYCHLYSSVLCSWYDRATPSIHLICSHCPALTSIEQVVLTSYLWSLINVDTVMTSFLKYSWPCHGRRACANLILYLLLLLTSHDPICMVCMDPKYLNRPLSSSTCTFIHKSVGIDVG